MRGLDADVLTWAGLLAQWTDLARAAVAFDDEGDEGRWKASIASVIALQATTCALADLGRLPMEERAVARDTASVLQRQLGAQLSSVWRGAMMPDALVALQDDAATAVERSRYVEAVQVIWSGPGPFVVPSRGIAELPDAIAGDREPRTGTLLVAQPGSILGPGSVVAWWVERPWPVVGDAFDALDVRETGTPPQVYRELGPDGSIVRDVVRPIWHEPMAGLPMLVPLLVDGEPVGSFTLDAEAWRAQQAVAWPGDPDADVLPIDALDDDPAFGDATQALLDAARSRPS